MLSAVLTLRLDLFHTSPRYVSCVYTNFNLIQLRLPHARAIYLCVLLIELTGKASSSSGSSSSSSGGGGTVIKRQGWKRQTQMLRGGKKEETR